MFVSQIYDECAEILGTTDEGKVFRKIQQAVATLMESGHWTHSVADVDVCTGWDRCSITLPRGIDVPLAVNIDGSPTYFRNRLFQYHVNKGGMFNSVEWAWDDRGYVATLMDIIQPSQLVAVAEMENDVGKTIRVIGKDQDNRTLRSQLANGTGVDGLLVPIHSKSDFAYGVIGADDATVKTRSVAVTPINLFTSSISHGLSSGQAMSVTNTSGTIPVSLEDGQTYYIGVIDAFTVQLFSDPLNAQSLQYPINLNSIVGSGNLKFQDTRNSQVVTALKLSEAPEFTLDTANQITFPSEQSLPSPLNSNQTYYANAEDSTHLTVFESEDDAKKNINPVYTTGSTEPLNIDIRKKINPQTTLTFSVRHYYNDGDQVQAFTSSGNLPKPLIPNQNYFVNVIDPFTVSIHENQSDALSSSSTNLINPITITDAGSGTNSLVKLIPATVTIGTKQQVSANGLNIDVPTGSGAICTAIVVGSVTSVEVTDGGSGYTSTPNVTFSQPKESDLSGGPFEGQARTARGFAVRNTVDDTISAIVITDPGFGYSSNPEVSITESNPQDYSIIKIQKINANTARVYINIDPSWDTSTKITFSGTGSNVYDGKTFQISLEGVQAGQWWFQFTTTLTAVNIGAVGKVTKVGGGTAIAVASVTTSFVSKVKINDGGSEYTGSPQVKFTASSGSGATATATTANGQVTEVKVITTGTGYENPPSVTITPSTGVFVSFTSTGTLPSPITSGSAYLAQDPIPGKFTVQNLDFSEINITSVGTGSLFVSLSRAFNVTFNNRWQGDFSNLTTGAGIYFASDYLLPITNPPIDNSVTQYFLNKLNNTTTQIYGNSLAVETITCADKIATVTTISNHNYSIGDTVNISGAIPDGYNGDFKITDVNYAAKTFTYSVASNFSENEGLNVTAKRIITPILFGSGQSYYAIRKTFQSLPYGNLIAPSGIEYLKENEVVQFSTTAGGLMPSPLLPLTDYTIKLSGSSFKVYLGSTLQVLQTPGSGQLSLNIIRIFNVSPSTSVKVDQSHLNTGDAIIPRAKDGDVLPIGLTPETTYYARRLNNNSLELYNTQARANNEPSTSGRISFTSTGNTVQSTFFVDSVTLPTFVKSVYQIEKPVTEGYVSLYAYDFGRSNDMTLIGQYHPSEVNPQYRKIRLGKPCAWARISYRIQAPTITSIYDFIPLEQERAIITAVHACDLEDKDFADQSARYWQIAFSYLKNQQESIDGHAMVTPQINGLCYAEGYYSDPIMS